MNETYSQNYHAGGGNKATKGPRACATCARAKSRCIPGPVADICERCHRLKKPCSSQIPAPPRKKKEPRPNRVAELERRLEDLRTRLQPVVEAQKQAQHHDLEDGGQGHDYEDEDERLQQQPTPPGDHPASPVKTISSLTKCDPPAFMHLFPADIVSPTRRRQWSEDESMGDVGRSVSCGSNSNSDDTRSPTPMPQSHLELSGTANIPTPESSALPSQQDYSRTDVPEDFTWPDQAEAVEHVAFYRDHLAKLFPFVVIPPGMTAEQLRQRRPFLWKGVMMASCLADGERQMAMGNQLIRDIAVASFTEPRRSLDLLQGLHLILAWYHYNLNSFQTTNLVFLARSICLALGCSEPQSGGQVWPQQQTTSATLEEMRAFAGTYYLVTLVFTTNKKPDVLMSSNYLDQCCQVIQSRMEIPTDELLVYLVKIQQLSQTIAITLSLRSKNIGVGATGGSGLQMDLPLTILVRGFQQQLNALMQEIPASVKEDTSFLNHYHVAHILLGEVGLHEPAEGSVMSPADRLELLWGCLAACKDFMSNRFRTLFDIGPRPTPRFCCVSSYDFIYAFTTSLRLMLLQVPGWDRAVVRSQLDLIQAIDNQRQDIECVMRFRESGRKKSQPRQRDSSAVASPSLGDSDASIASSDGSPAQAQSCGLTPAGTSPPSSGTTTKTSLCDFNPGPIPLTTDGRRPDPFHRLHHRLVQLRNVLESEAAEAIQAVLATQGTSGFVPLGSGLGPTTTKCMATPNSMPTPCMTAPPTTTAAAAAPREPPAAMGTEATNGSTGNSTITNVGTNVVNTNGIPAQTLDELPTEMEVDPWGTLFTMDDDWDPTTTPDWGRGLWH